jgi:ankyrin repeat protein
MNGLYRSFRRALKHKDAAALSGVIQNNPSFHAHVGRWGSLVLELDAEAPELLEIAFLAGLSPDSGQADCRQTFLQKAAGDGDAEKVRLAIRYGANLDRRSSRGETALGYACSWGHLEVVRLLVEAGADVNTIEHDPEDDFRNTALDCCRGKPEIEQYLRSKGALTIAEIERGVSQGGLR